MLNNVVNVFQTVGSESFTWGKTVLHSTGWAVSNIVSSVFHIV